MLERYTMLRDWKNTVKIHSIKAIYKSNAIPTKILLAFFFFFTEMEKIILKFWGTTEDPE